MEVFNCFEEIENWERSFLKDSSYYSYKVDSPSDSGNVLTFSEDERVSSNLSTPTNSITCGSRSLSMDDESSNDVISDYSYRNGDDNISSPSSYSSETSEEPTSSGKRKRTSNQAPVHTDGFKWRKYGQKHVKGNKYPRNYYKCTVKDCPARKYVEKIVDRDGAEMESVEYVNEHIHPPPNASKIIVTDQDDLKFVVKAHTKFMYDNNQSNYVTDDQKLVIECRGHIDYGEDGYSWKKYGQKNIKGAFRPRQYYKCTYPKCTVKKQIESYTCTHIVITYDGKHQHLPKSETKQVKIENQKIEELDYIYDMFKPFDQAESKPKTVTINYPQLHDNHQMNCNFQHQLYSEYGTPQHETDYLLEDFGLIAPTPKRMNITGSMNFYEQVFDYEYFNCN